MPKKHEIEERKKIQAPQDELVPEVEHSIKKFDDIHAWKRKINLEGGNNQISAVYFWNDKNKSKTDESSHTRRVASTYERKTNESLQDIQWQIKQW